jgi:hypothetical protein
MNTNSSGKSQDMGINISRVARRVRLPAIPGRVRFRPSRYLSRVLSGLAILAFSLHPYPSHAQDAPEPVSVLDIQWGTSVADAKDLLNQRTDISGLEETTAGLNFTGGIFAGIPVKEWRFDFAGGKFSEAVITFVYPRGRVGKVLGSDLMYDNLKKLISDKYGGEGAFSGGANSGHNTMVWTFPDSPASKGVKNIKLTYNWNGRAMTITYINQFYESSVAAAAHDL